MKAEGQRGNRLFRDECLRCGTPLIADMNGNFNDLHCCTPCEDFVKRSIYESNNHRHRLPKNRKRTVSYKHLVDIKHIVDVGKEPGWNK